MDSRSPSPTPARVGPAAADAGGAGARSETGASADRDTISGPTLQDIGLAAPWLMSMIAHVILLLSLAPWYAGSLRGGGEGFRGTSVIASLESDGQGSVDGPGAADAGLGDDVAAGPALDTPADYDLAASALSEVGSRATGVEIPAELAAPVSANAPVDPFARQGSSQVRGGQNPGVNDILDGLDGKPGGGSADRGTGLRRGGSLPGGAQTGVFGITGQGYKFVYVFDRSSSMGAHDGAPLAAAKQQLLASLSDLGAVHQFQIIFYNERPQIFSAPGAAGRLVFANDQFKRLAMQYVRGIAADGGTHHEDALAMALRLAPDVIFFLTDADEPRMTAGQLARIQRLNRGATVHTIEFGYGPQQGPENFLAQVAHQNGGEYVYIDIADLEQHGARVAKPREAQAAR